MLGPGNSDTRYPGTSTRYMETKVTTGNPTYDEFYPGIKNFLEQDQVTYTIDGERVHGYRSPDCNALWLRDHSDILRGARYFEEDMLSGISHFAKTQRTNGSIFDFVSCAMDRENWTKYVRVPVEADVEYRFVKAIFLGWQATGDDDWLAWILPHAEKAMQYSMSHPWRWCHEHGLIKRAYTIDTWDFDYLGSEQAWLNFQVSDRTHWGIFHGDNSGFYEACRLMAKFYHHLGKQKKQGFWVTIADKIRQRTNELCWNGRFYTHRVPLDDFHIPDVDEAAQLSLSNPMAINRGLATHEMAVAVIREYQQRRAKTDTFAEWFSIDPPFPDGCFGDPKLIQGAYVNGGIMPLVGGELARAAFEHGFEAYGLSILQQYARMIQETGATYLWYFPNGTPSSEKTSTSPEATPTDGWGSSAMLFAFMEGLVGVVDADYLFRKVRLSPRWCITSIHQAQVQVKYGASEGYLRYDFQYDSEQCRLIVDGDGEIQLHLLLPDGKRAKKVRVDNIALTFQNVSVESSSYVDAEFCINGRATLDVIFE